MKHWWFFLYFLAPCFTIAQGYNFVGDSYSLGNDCYTLTPGQEWQNGAIWYNQSINLNDAFQLQFTANFGSNDAGADGMVFVLQQVDNEILGEAGGGMGFSGFSPSLGVEFDTFQNPETSDPPADHLAVLTNGVNDHQSPNNLYGPFSIAEGSDNIEDGQDHIIDIFWDPNTTEFQVWVDCIPRVDLNVDLLGTVFTDSPEVFWGFTGATGGFFNQQTICLDPYILGTPDQYETCPGIPVELEASAATFGTLSWEPAEFLDDPNSNTPIATVDETTEFTLTYEDLCNEQQVSTTTVIVYDPSVELGEDLTVCEGEAVNIQPQGEFEELIWSDGSSGQSFEITESGAYWVEALQGVCTAYDTVSVEFIPLPDWDNIFEEICEGETVQVDLSSAGYDVEWFDGSSETIRSFSEGGNYAFNLTNQGCQQAFFVEIDLTEIPEFEFSEVYTLCEGESLILETGLSGAEILWNNGDVSNSIEIDESGYYWAIASVNGCEYADTTEVVINSVESFEIFGTESLCPGESGQLKAETTGNVTWTNGEMGGNLIIDLPGTYTAISLDENGCESSASFFVEGLSLPRIVLSERVEKCEGETLRVFAQSSDDTALAWNEGTTGPVLLADADGEYTVSLSNECGTTERTVRVDNKLCGQSFYIPNAFSPDQDGLNDIFKVITDDLEAFELRIFNRSGQEVFYSTEPESGWNGSFQNNGYYCQPGVYMVKYKLQFDSNTIYEGIGHLNLIR